MSDSTVEIPDLVVDACGAVIAIRAPDRATWERWRRQWSRALSAHPAEDADATLTVQPAPDGQPPEIVDYALASRVTYAALSQTVGARLSLHGAALADPEGRVLALVAASGTGKTTASRTLGQALGYLSDETVSVGANHDVLTYAKPLSVVIDPRDPHRKEQLSPDELGLLVPPDRTRLHRLVFLERDDPGNPGLEPVPVAEALSGLVPQMSYVFSWDAPLLELTRLVLACGGAWRLRYAEIGDHLDDLMALLDAPLEDALDPVAVVHHPGATPPDGASGTYGRTPWHDAVEVDDEVIVLVGAHSFRLDLLGATLWLALDEARSLGELVAVAVDEHGPHPDSETLVRDALGVLLDAQLVREF